MKAGVYNMDCMEAMKSFPDNYFDLAVVDPPYGIGFDGQRESTSKHGGRKAKEFKGWDDSVPNSEYWSELFRVSKNQIVWGANYFTEHLPPSMGWIFWDKGQRICSSDGELAFTSFNRALRVYELNRVYITQHGEINHPTQKPVKLYEWIYMNYLPQGGKVLDTHLGSGSNRIAADKQGNIEFYGFEIDKEYFDASVKRFDQYKAQLTMF
jgi:site-specific DNA-methyltransferase (adenine-specific)